jgi:methionine sulfoxide reductase catalytic subunit
MLIRRRKDWEIPEREATPERFFLDRRALLKSLGAGTAALAASGFAAAPFWSAEALAATVPNAGLYPAKRNPAYKLDRPITPESVNTHYNNFYEFSMSKSAGEDAQQALVTEPWTVQLDGLVEKPQTFAVDDLIRRMPFEERLYRHRCVEAWSMTIPWTGFALKQLVALAKPLSGAKYVHMQTFMNPKMAPGQRQFWYPWPYVEGLTIAEANNDLAFMVTGAYGKPLAKCFGAPLRLATPWKYGFKSIKSITRISFVAERPKTFWETLGPSEYGFWANVNPQVPHPRWSQATEEIIGTGGQRRPTLLYNGYGEQVAGLYAGLSGEKLFM